MAKDSKIQGMMAGSSPKQKVMAVLVVVIFLFVIWQAIGMFGGGEAAVVEPAPVPAKPMAAGSPQGGAPNQQAGQTPPGPAPAPGQAAAPMTPPQQEIQETRLQPSEFLAAQQETQKNYVNAINQLQMLRIEKEIAETNQAIAKAKLDTVTSEKSVSDLLAKPLPQAPAPPSAYSQQLGGGTSRTDSTFVTQTTGPTSAQTIPPPPIAEGALPEVSYVAISVSMQLNKWTAVLGYSGQLYNVAVGDVIPADGSTVVSISKNGVVLRKNGKRRKVSIVTSI